MLQHHPARDLEALAVEPTSRIAAQESHDSADVVGLGRAAQGRYLGYPGCADTPEIEVLFVPEIDPDISAIGAKGIGELGVVGLAAAIANAVYNATGKRIRTFPITPDKLV